MSHAIAPVVVGVDGSPVSLQAVDLAAGEAALREVPLRVVHVVEPFDLHGAVEGVLSLAGRTAEHRHPGLAISTHTLRGSPGAALVEQSRSACLTVVGHRGSGGFPGLTAGAVCGEVVAGGYGPILVARGAVPLYAAAPVVVGVNAGAPVTDVIGFAFIEAAVRGVPVHVVSVHTHESAFAAEAERQLAGWAERYPDVKVDQFVERELSPSATMLSTSSHAGLVVVGPHSRLPQRGQYLGPVTVTLTHHARCPIAVVHSRVRRAQLLQHREEP